MAWNILGCARVDARFQISVDDIKTPDFNSNPAIGIWYGKKVLQLTTKDQNINCGVSKSTASSHLEPHSFLPLLLIVFVR